MIAEAVACEVLNIVIDNAFAAIEHVAEERGHAECDEQPAVVEIDDFRRGAQHEGVGIELECQIILAKGEPL